MFLEVGSFGYRSSYLQYLGEAVTAFFNVSVPATNRKSQTIIFRFSSVGLERYESKVTLSPEKAIFDNIIYAGSDQGIVKWSGEHFEPTNAEEQQRFVTRSAV